MEEYTLIIICAIGVAGRASFDTFKKDHDEGNFNPYLVNHSIGALIGTFLTVGVLAYTFIHFKWWHTFTVLLIASLIAMICLKIVTRIFGITYSRLLFIWILPIAAAAYFIFKII